MAKQPLGWHKQCLANQYRSLEEKQERLERLKIEVDRDRKETTFYHVQINEAEIKKKTGFEEQNNWIRHSWHKDAEHAIINADVIARSRNCRARVISGGNIVHEVGVSNGR